MPITIASGGDASVRILLDRQSALDIGAFSVDGIDLSPGTAIPDNGDRRIDHALAGFLFTCGPDHIRHPEPVAGADDGRAYPLHGSLSGTPVGETTMSGADASQPSCDSKTDVDLADGGRAQIIRRFAIGGDPAEVILSDRVYNIGERPFAPMLMYHLNIGGWLCGDGTGFAGAMLPGGRLPWRFGEGESAHLCLDATASAVDGWAEVAFGPFEALGLRSLFVRFETKTLPFLQIWRCQRGAADVISIEPVSHRIASRTALSQAGELPELPPGEAIGYALAFGVR